jgi:membrane AbrB-like protein
MIVLVPAVALAWRADSIAATPPPTVAPLFESILILVGGALGGLAAERLRLPAGLMVGAAVAVAALQVTDIAAGALPQWVLLPAFILLGLMLGSRFCGVSPWLFFRLLGAGLAGLLVAASVAAAGALLASGAIGISPLVTLIAFAPGGLEAMTIMALALGLDAAFVGTHQIARFLFLSLALPLVVGVLKRHWAGR